MEVENLVTESKRTGGVQDVGIAIISNWLSILYFGRIGCWLYGCTKKYIVDENVPVTDVRFDKKNKVGETQKLR